MKAPARVVFLGTGDIAIPSYRRLRESGVELVGLVTQPDRPAGRHRRPKPPAIKALAEEDDLTVWQPERIRKPEALEGIRAMAPDLMVVMAYGQILPEELIRMAPLGCVNLHASLLPKYRGAACIQAAIDAGDERSGVTLMHVVKELDAGDVILSVEEKIRADDTGGSLHDRLALVAAEALGQGLPALLAGTAPRTPQAELGESSYAPKLERDDGRIDWSWSAGALERRLRAYDPWPGCHASYDDGQGGKRLKVFPARELLPQGGELGMEGECVRGPCGEGSLVLGDVQPEGARRMPAAAWWRGLRNPEKLRLD